MKVILSAVCVAAACAMTASAQQSASSTSKQSGLAGQSGQAGANIVTLTGCVEAGETTNSLVLTHVSGLPGKRGSGSTGTTAASGTSTGMTATGTSGKSSQRLMLNPGGGVDVSSHVGHRVEVTGTLADRGSNPAGSSSGTGMVPSSQSAGATGGSAVASGQGIGGEPTRTFVVTTVRQLSSTCNAR